MTGVLVDYFKTQRAVRGDAFATQAEMQNLLADPWACCDLARPLFDVMFYSGADSVDYTYDPNYSRGVVEVHFYWREPVESKFETFTVEKEGN